MVLARSSIVLHLYSQCLLPRRHSWSLRRGFWSEFCERVILWRWSAIWALSWIGSTTHWPSADVIQHPILRKTWKVITWRWRLQLAINAPFGLLWVADKTNPVVHAFDMSVLTALHAEWLAPMMGIAWATTTNAEWPPALKIQFQNRRLNLGDHLD